MVEEASATSDVLILGIVVGVLLLVIVVLLTAFAIIAKKSRACFARNYDVPLNV